MPNSRKNKKAAESEVDEMLSALKIDSLKGIFVSHSHHDLALDVGTIGKNWGEDLWI